jgi:predicted nuclease of restriction endonuclease-like (RecB) superfamily
MSKKIVSTTQPEFDDVLQLVLRTRQQVFTQANTALIDLYWLVGKTISQKVQNGGWGKSVVLELADYITRNAPDVKGFSDKNLWRMKQFYEAYQTNQELLPLVKQLPWSHNLAIFSRCKTLQERIFYLELAVAEKYSFRELDRQISVSLFERTSLDAPKLSTPLRVLNPATSSIFKDNYILEFLGLPVTHSENHLQKALVQHMKQFILELGKDFIFMGEEYRLQVGNQDFFIDLLFYHRGLTALVAFELKVGKFSPEHLGQMNFYLEALDRDVKKPHENPSIGILLCRDKDDEVVEYALSRHLSPTLVAQYELQLPDKKIIRAKLHELSVQLPLSGESEHGETP